MASDNVDAALNPCPARPLYIWLRADFNPYNTGMDSDVRFACRLQILTSKVHPGTERLKILILAVDPEHRYLNEAEMAIY